MESDDDFLPPTQFGTQHRGSNRQAVTSTSRQAWDRPGPNRPGQSSQSQGRPSQSQGRPSQSQGRLSQDEELSQIKDGMEFLMQRIQQLTGDSRGTKRPAEPKPLDQKPKTKEQCRLCKKYLANKTNLFRHYRAMHPETSLEKCHGCSVNSTVVSLDTSFRETTCNICGYVAATQNALDTHNRDVHGNVINNANDRAVANVNSTSDNITNAASASNKENVSNNAIMNRLHKCEKCACYFEERNKFDEHMKVQHGFQFVCHICNEHLLFKDVDGHVKEVHPDVYEKNNEKNEKLIIEKMMRNAKGNRVLVFICSKCDIKMVNKIEAEKHARCHKGLKIKVAPRVKVSEVEHNFTDVSSNDHVIFTCDACDISTGSYDAAVEHAQNHIINNLNDIVTQQCRICRLKFQPICSRTHVGLHYKNEEIHKESFRHFKYTPQVLLYENSFSTEPDLKKIIDESVFRHTRSVRMWFMPLHEPGTYNLYKCCQCNNFVEPAAVLNHAINYDTCVKVKRSYTCDICERKFNNRLARNNHAKDHKSEENYKTVLFNRKDDKEFNKILNNINNDANTRKLPTVLYKCLCGLCFVRKENADVHIKICPGKDPRTLCPKCNNLFNPEELLSHCFEQHLEETQIVVENVTPDVIVIDEEESENRNADIIEIDSSDDDEAETARIDNIKIEVFTQSDAEKNTGSSEDAERQNRNASRSITEPDKNEQVVPEGNLLIAKSEEDIDEDEDRGDNDFGGTDEMTDDNSQDTITYENTATATDVVNPVMNKQDKVKCVSTNLLLNPLHFEKEVGVLNAEITATITSIRQELETTNASCNVIFDAKIKNEESWFDPTNFSNIRSRPSLRHPAPNNLSQDIVDLLLTDDEETEMNHDEDGTETNDNIRSEENNDTPNKGSENNDMREGLNNKISNTPVTEQRQNVSTIDTNDIHTSNNEDISAIVHNEENNIEKSICENNADFEAQPVLININGEGVTNDSTHSSHEAVNNDQNYSDHEDDLFIPSGIENRETSRNTELTHDGRGIANEQFLTQVDSATNEFQSDNNIEETGGIRVENPQDNIVLNDIRCDAELTHDGRRIANEKQFLTQVDSATNEFQSDNNIEETDGVRVENPQDNIVLNDIRSDDTNDVLNTPNEKEIDNESYVSIEHDEDTQEYVECTLRETSAYSISDIAGHEVREELSEKQTVNIKKEFDYMNINIKRELIEENIQENEYGFEDVRIKPEPKDWNENNENEIFLLNNNVNYNNCSIC